MSLLFSDYSLPAPEGSMQLPNRVVVAPMCQYSAVEGEASDWHLMHWGNLLNSGAGLFIIEATA
ncbi:MAG: oxidoreductase, partial [Burkholderiaceae bacterium]|nr:oxidoreductase [Burkholderiaceae bacterium]